MEGGERMLMAAGLTAAVVVGAFVLWGPGRPARKRRGQIAGLHNLGRTCFLNTLLQALAAQPAFAAWLRRRRAPGTQPASMLTTLSTVIEVVNGTHEAARGAGPVCPLGVLRCLGALGWVVPEDQHDAHELLHVILSCVDEETIASSKKQPGCLSDALGLFSGGISSPEHGEGRRDDLPLAPFPSLRSVSSPATPDSPLVKCARSLSQAAITLSDKTKTAARDLNGSTLHPEFGNGITLTKGVSRSFCQLDRLGRPTLPSPPPPQLPFHGTLATRLQCTICSYKSPIRYDKFDSLSLQLVDRNGPLSISGLLRTFTSPEMVKGVACTRCNEDRDSSLPQILTTHIKSQKIGKLPVCLCLHIGRTQWGPSGLTKHCDHVIFQETLVLAPFTASQPQKVDVDIESVLSQSVPTTVGQYAHLIGSNANGGQGDWRTLYRLQAVVVHVGGPRSGHFITYRRGNGFEAKRWFYTSDTVVYEVSLDEVLRSSAYMLFYEKASIASQKPQSGSSRFPRMK